MVPLGLYARLPTEQHPSHRYALETFSTLRLLRLMSREDAHAVRAVTRQHRAIARAVALIARAMQQGGRLFFVGAGTSGRLAVLEAAECPPTFHTPPALVQAIIAGGHGAVFRSREGAEDRGEAAARLVRRRARSGDVVVGITASGVTPFVRDALRAARARGARTILVTCHPRAPIQAAVRIRLAVGPEVLVGSTRLKAATATKLVLNMLTLGTMVRLGKVYGNLMVDVRPTSRKLHARAVRIIQELTGCAPATASRALRQARGRVKIAVLMVHRRLSETAARRRLAAARGSLRDALR